MSGTSVAVHSFGEYAAFRSCFDPDDTGQPCAGAATGTGNKPQLNQINQAGCRDPTQHFRWTWDACWASHSCSFCLALGCLYLWRIGLAKGAQARAHLLPTRDVDKHFAAVRLRLPILRNRYDTCSTPCTALLLFAFCHNRAKGGLSRFRYDLDANCP